MYLSYHVQWGMLANDSLWLQCSKKDILVHNVWHCLAVRKSIVLHRDPRSKVEAPVESSNYNIVWIIPLEETYQMDPSIATMFFKSKWLFHQTMFAETYQNCRTMCLLKHIRIAEQLRLLLPMTSLTHESKVFCKL